MEFVPYNSNLILPLPWLINFHFCYFELKSIENMCIKFTILISSLLDSGTSNVFYFFNYDGLIVGESLGNLMWVPFYDNLS